VIDPADEPSNLTVTDPADEPSNVIVIDPADEPSNVTLIDPADEPSNVTVTDPADEPSNVTVTKVCYIICLLFTSDEDVLDAEYDEACKIVKEEIKTALKKHVNRDDYCNMVSETIKKMSVTP
jgi:uncharacterized UPF0160 family protein